MATFTKLKFRNNSLGAISVPGLDFQVGSRKFPTSWQPGETISLAERGFEKDYVDQCGPLKFALGLGLVSVPDEDEVTIVTRVTPVQEKSAEKPEAKATSPIMEKSLDTTSTTPNDSGIGEKGSVTEPPTNPPVAPKPATRGRRSKGQTG